MADGMLVLGPFVGRPACIRIPLDKGVCGAAARSGVSQLVEDVHSFPGHIACDSASRSELVVPVLRDGVVIAVIDLDSPELNRTICRFSPSRIWNTPVVELVPWLAPKEPAPGS